MPKRIRQKWLLCIMAVIFLLCTTRGYAQSSYTYQIEADVIAGGGGDLSSPNYDLFNSVGQCSPIGPSSSPNYINFTGFWYAVPYVPPVPPSPIILQLPFDGAIFNSCALVTGYQPTFTWTSTETFTNCTILFSTPGGAQVAKGSVRGPANTWIPSSAVWKKLMTSASQNGEIYWKVVGTRPNRTTAESQSWSFSVGPPQAATINSPTNGSIFSATPPTFDFNTNCNVKFKLEISAIANFTDPRKIKGFSYTTKDPNVDQKLIKTLSSSQWNAVKKMIGVGTGYFRIRAWDGIKRETTSEIRWFVIQ